MMYQGSKSRYAKYILPIILSERRPYQVYIEPFVGGANVIQYVSSPCFGYDNNWFLIELLKGIQKGWIPPEYITEEQYYNIKANQRHEDPRLVGFVGFCCSFAGKWWGGYARGKDSKGNARNYCLEKRNGLLKQAPKIKHVRFKYGDYTECVNTECLYYLDPPYNNTLKYNSKFDHDKFWNWTRELSQHNTVYISEYIAPIDFECVWAMPVKRSSITPKNRGTEKLWTLKK